MEVMSRPQSWTCNILQLQKPTAVAPTKRKVEATDDPAVNESNGPESNEILNVHAISTVSTTALSMVPSLEESEVDVDVETYVEGRVDDCASEVASATAPTAVPNRGDVVEPQTSTAGDVAVEGIPQSNGDAYPPMSRVTEFNRTLWKTRAQTALEPTKPPWSLRDQGEAVVNPETKKELSEIRNLIERSFGNKPHSSILYGDDILFQAC